jgi:uncharacterized protein (DUF1330 family)
MEARHSAGVPGYLLVVGRIGNPAQMGEYSRALPAVYARYGGAYVAIGGPGRGVDWLAGPHRDRSLVLARFGSPEAVREFWWSPEYRSAAKLREGAGTFNVVGIPGRAGSAPPVGGACLIVAMLVQDGAACDAWRAAYATELAAHGGEPLASATAADWLALEGDPAWDRVEIAHLPSAAAAESLVSNPRTRELQERAGLAFVARAAVVAPAR